MDFVELLYLSQQLGVVSFQLQRDAQQDHVFGGAVAGKVIQPARGIRLGGGDQRVHQAAAGLQDEAVFVTAITPVTSWASSSLGLEGQGGFLGGLGYVLAHTQV